MVPAIAEREKFFIRSFVRTLGCTFSSVGTGQGFFFIRACTFYSPPLSFFVHGRKRRRMSRVAKMLFISREVEEMTNDASVRVERRDEVGLVVHK